MTAAASMSAFTIALGNATVPSSDESSLLRISLWTDAQPSSDTMYSSLKVYVNAADFVTVWNSPMHLSSFAPQEIQIHVHGAITPEITSSLQTSLLLAGLVATGECKQEDGTVVWQAQKRAADVRLQAKPLLSSITNTATLDENTLLDSDLLAPPPAMSAVATKDDCSGREPCADCTCGRKEGTNVLLEQQPQQQPPSSSCGKCGLGDAFRCASCPYLGKPAFKAGEEHLVLELQDDF